MQTLNTFIHYKFRLIIDHYRYYSSKEGEEVIKIIVIVLGMKRINEGGEPEKIEMKVVNMKKIK